MARKTKQTAYLRTALRNVNRQFLSRFRIYLWFALRNAGRRIKKFFSPFYIGFVIKLRNANTRIKEYILSFTLVELKRLFKLCVVFICISYVLFNMFVLIDFTLRYRAIYGIDHTIYLLMSPARRVFFKAERSVKRGDEAKALMEFETAVEIDKKLLTGYVRLGEMYLELKNHEKAFMYFKK